MAGKGSRTRRNHARSKTSDSTLQQVNTENTSDQQVAQPTDPDPGLADAVDHSQDVPSQDGTGPEAPEDQQDQPDPDPHALTLAFKSMEDAKAHFRRVELKGVDNDDIDSVRNDIKGSVCRILEAMVVPHQVEPPKHPSTISPDEAKTEWDRWQTVDQKWDKVKSKVDRTDSGRVDANVEATAWLMVIHEHGYKPSKSYKIEEKMKCSERIAKIEKQIADLKCIRFGLINKPYNIQGLLIAPNEYRARKIRNLWSNLQRKKAKAEREKKAQATTDGAQNGDGPGAEKSDSTGEDSG